MLAVVWDGDSLHDAAVVPLNDSFFRVAVVPVLDSIALASGMEHRSKQKPNRCPAHECNVDLDHSFTDLMLELSVRHASIVAAFASRKALSCSYRPAAFASSKSASMYALDASASTSAFAAER